MILAKAERDQSALPDHISNYLSRHYKWCAFAGSCLTNGIIVFALLNLESVGRPGSSMNNMATIDVEIIFVEPPLLLETEDVPSKETPETQVLATQNPITDRDKETSIANLPPAPKSDDDPVEPRNVQTEEVTAFDGSHSKDIIKPSTYISPAPLAKSGQNEAADPAVSAIRQIQCAKTGPNRPSYCDDEIVWAANEYPALENTNAWEAFKKEETFLDTEAARTRARGCLNNGTGFVSGEGPIVARTEYYLQGPGKTFGRPAGKRKNRYFCDFDK